MTTGPPAAPRPTAPPATAPNTITVQAGDSFWSIAERAVRRRLGVTPTPAQVGRYWLSLVGANGDRLPLPGDPNLIFPGTTLLLP